MDVYKRLALNLITTLIVLMFALYMQNINDNIVLRFVIIITGIIAILYLSYGIEILLKFIFR